MRKYVLLMIITSAISISCSRNHSWKREIKSIYGSTLSWDWEKQYFFHDKVSSGDCFTLSPIKIVSYIDDNLCDSCFVNYLKGASVFMKNIHTDSVAFLAIVRDRTDEQLSDIAQRIKTNNIVIVQDKFGHSWNNDIFTRKNLPSQVFLLDPTNKIILIGDPLLNYKLEQLYSKTIEDMLTKRKHKKGNRNHE